MILNNSYMNDFFCGGDTVEEFQDIKKQLIRILESGEFFTAKWAAYHSEICSDIDGSLKQFEENQELSTLVIYWIAENDSFSLKVLLNTEVSKFVTKIIILSEVSKLFDPLG